MPIRITKRDIDALLKATGRPQISDTQPGLVLRRRAGTACWYFRLQADGRDKLLPIGTVAELTADEARRVASDLMYDVGRGIVPDELYIAKKRHVLQIDDVAPPEPKSDKPTFGQAQNLFLNYVQAERAPKTYVDYAAALREPLLKPLAQTPVERLTREDLAEVVDKISRSGRQRSAAKLAAILSSMWSWMTHDSNIRQFGVSRGILLRFKPMERAGAKRELRTPDPEAVRSLLRRRDEQPGVVADAILLLAHTAQRRLTVVKASRDQFYEEDGRLLWDIPAESMKAGRRHVIPVPELLRPVIRRVESGLLFPSSAVDGVGLSEFTLTNALRSMKVGFTPHDIRRAFTEHVRSAGFPRTDAKLILNHAEDRANDVTASHYDFHDDLDRKAAIMASWTDVLEGRTASKAKAVRKAA